MVSFLYTKVNLQETENYGIKVRHNKKNERYKMIIKLIYGLITIISVLLLVSYYRQIEDRKNWFVLLYVSVCVVNMGYFMMSISSTLKGALFANRLSYFGSVFLPLCMLMIILDVCKINCRKWLVYVLSTVSVIVFLIAASGGITEWYYKEVSIIYIEGAAKLIKEYGPLHNIYYVYLFSYFAAMISVILYATKSKHLFNSKHASLLVGVVFGNIGIWFVEQMIKVDFEFLSISYIITELFLLLLYGILQEHAMLMQNPQTVEAESINVDEFVKNCPELDCLTARELEVLKPILEDKKRKDIAEELNVSESTIKKHTAHIFAKLEVSNRKELYAKIGYKP